MFHLDRDRFRTQTEFLYYIYNNLGCVDLEIAYFDGNLWSKWYRFDVLMHKEKDEIVWRGLTVEEFIEKANNRTVLDIELLFDFDEDAEGNQDPDKIKEYAKNAISILNKSKIFGIAYFSGSKSIHYSVLIPELRLFSGYQRTEIKNRALQPLMKNKQTRFTADLGKKSKRTMIAMEGQFHWKTGKIKKKVIL